MRDQGWDVVVIGGGLAGMVAGATLAGDDISAAVLEAADDVGGASRMSAGLFAFAGTAEQRDAGIKDSREALQKDLRRSNGAVGPMPLVDLYVEHQSAAKEWLDRRGVRWILSNASGSNQGVPRSHRTDMDVLFSTLRDDISASPRVRVLRSHKVTDIKQAGDRWMIEVSGVEPGKRHVLAASKVIVAAGGFAANPDAVSRNVPSLSGAIAITAPTCDGSMLHALVRAGAGTCDLDCIGVTFGNHPDSAGSLYPCLGIYLGAIAVNLEGRRFVDESRPYKEIGADCLKQPGGVAVQILDAGVRQRSVVGGGPFDLDRWEDAGLLLKHDSLAAVAAEYSLHREALEAQLTRYNTDLARYGYDREYGRKSVNSARLKLCQINSPPYYSFLSTAAIYGTYGGARVDSSLRVECDNGSILPGAYAAGEVVGGFHGTGYMTGTSLGKALVFGRLAARHAMSASQAVTQAWA